MYVYRRYMSCLNKRALVDMQRRRHPAPAGARVPACGSKQHRMLTAGCPLQSGEWIVKGSCHRIDTMTCRRGVHLHAESVYHAVEAAPQRGPAGPASAPSASPRSLCPQHSANSCKLMRKQNRMASMVRPGRLPEVGMKTSALLHTWSVSNCSTGASAAIAPYNLKSSGGCGLQRVHVGCSKTVSCISR